MITGQAKTDGKTAVIYTRVSSEDQVAGTSLDSQLADCRRWAASNGCRVAAERSDAGESAKTADRPGLIAAMDDARRLKADFLVVAKLDRLSRNAGDGLAIRAALKRHGCALVSCSEPAGHDPVGDLVSTVMFAVAQFDNDLRSQRSTRGMRETALRGGWVAHAPCGFLPARSGSLPVLAQDPAKGPAIARALRAFAAGVTTKGQTLRALREVGMPSQSASNALRQPVYGGLIRGSLTGGVDVQAAFPGLVTPAEWYRIEARLAGPRRNASAANEGFPLAGCLACPVCGLSVTASSSRGRSGRYDYYHCHEGHVRVRASDVHARLRELLDGAGKLTLLLDRVVKRVIRRMAQDEEKAAKERGRVKAEASKIEGRIARLTEGWTDGIVPDDQYRAQLARLRRLHAEADEAAKDAVGATDFGALAGKCRTLLGNASNLWETLDLQGKKAFFTAVFGRMTLEADGKLSNRTQVSLFTALYDLSEDDIWEWCGWREKYRTVYRIMEAIVRLAA